MVSPGERPYVKYASDGSNTIHFIYTEAHPDSYAGTSIYHMYYRNGGLYQSDGTFITNLVDAPIAPQLGTKIYDGTNATGEGWTWDVHLDTNGHPVVPYTAFTLSIDPRYRLDLSEGTLLLRVGVGTAEMATFTIRQRHAQMRSRAYIPADRDGQPYRS